MNLYNKLRETGNGSVINTGEKITMSQFLGKEEGNTPIYPNPSSFLNYVKTLTEEEFEQFEQFLGYVKNGNRVVGPLVTRKDRAKKAYLFPTFLRKRGTIGVKLVIQPPIKTFLDLYIDTDFGIDFTLEDLINEALKSA